MNINEMRAFYTKVPTFFYMNFDVANRREQLRKITNTVLSVDTAGDSFDFVIDVMGTGSSVTYTTVHGDMRDGKTVRTAIEGRLRDVHNYSRRVKFSIPEKGCECLIVGIVHNKEGLPVHAFEAKARNGHWMINNDVYKYFD